MPDDGVDALVDAEREAIARRLGRALWQLVAGDASRVPPLPWRMPVRRRGRRDLEASFADYSRQVCRLAEWASTLGLGVEWETRLVGTTRQRIPVAVTVPDVAVAAKAAGRWDGRDWQSELGAARRRNDAMTVSFPSLDAATRAKVLTQTRGMGDAEFEMLLSAGSWFKANDVGGMTPRSVPIPGFSGKWIDRAGNRTLVCLLSGRDELGLTREPRSFLYRCLDQEAMGALAAEGRSEYGVHVDGRQDAMAYEPGMVWVVENLATFHNFPALEGAVCVYGAGKACCQILGEVDWVRNAAKVFYWGDMDADGLEILNSYRSSGLECESILMDWAAYDEWERYGTNQATGSQPLGCHKMLNLDHLTSQERRLYEYLCSKECRGYRRVEQEKIPYRYALAAAGL